MALTSGTKLGPYEISELLGAGGMGEVYRARDARLDRSVAIKILPAVLAADQTEFSQRFSQSREDRFAGIDLKVGAGGTPLLPGCCAWFECRNEMRYAGGDHLILVGHVESFHREQKQPLIFHGGRYRTLA